MGPSQSSQNYLKIANQFTSQVLTNMFTSLSTSVGSTIISHNTMYLSLAPGGSINCGNVNINQQNRVTSKLSVTSTFKDTVSLQNTVSAAMSNAIAQANSSTQGALSLATSSTANSTSITNAMNNIIQTGITDETTTTVNNVILNLNKGTFLIAGNITCGANGTFTISQASLIENLVTVVASSITSKFVSNSISGSITNSTTQSNTTNQKGLEDLFSGIFKYLIIAAAIVAVIVAIFYIIRLMPKKNNTNPNLIPVINSNNIPTPEELEKQVTKFLFGKLKKFKKN